MSENLKDILDSIKEAINKNDDSIDSFLIDIECWKELLDYITNLQKRLDFMIDRNDEKQDRIDKALKIYENRNSVRFKKQRFMEDKDTGDLMYDVLKGEE